MKYRILQDTNWSGYYVGQIVNYRRNNDEGSFYSDSPNETGAGGWVVKYSDCVLCDFNEYLKLIKPK